MELPEPAISSTAGSVGSPKVCTHSSTPLTGSSRSLVMVKTLPGRIDKVNFYVQTHFCDERRPVPGSDRAGRDPAQAAARRSAAAVGRAPLVRRGGRPARPDPPAGLLPRE